MKEIFFNAHPECIASQYLSFARSLCYLLILKVWPSFSHAGLKNRLGKSVFWAHCSKATNLFSFYLIHLRKDTQQKQIKLHTQSLSDKIEFPFLKIWHPSWSMHSIAQIFASSFFVFFSVLLQTSDTELGSQNCLLSSSQHYGSQNFLVTTTRSNCNVFIIVLFYENSESVKKKNVLPFFLILVLEIDLFEK